MASETRIYVVQPKGATGAEKPSAARLVRAPNPSQVANHITRDFSIAIATHDDLERLLGAGVRVEKAGEEQQQLASGAASAGARSESGESGAPG